MKKLLLFLLAGVCSISAFSQSTTYAYETFRDTRVICGQSVETSVKGQMKFIISHRFGDIYVENPYSILYNFFGFSGGANMRIGLDYGITNWLEVGAGRSNLNKTYDGFVKARLLKQSSGDKNMPFSLTAFSEMSIVTDTNSTLVDAYFSDGFMFSNQLIIARKFSDGLSVQIMPTHVHRNLVELNSDPNDIIAIGAAAKIRLSKNVDLTGEYYYTLPNQLPTGYDNCLSLGVDIITKGHVFQLHLSNSPYLIPEHFISLTQGSIFDTVNGKPDINIRFGFNISRTFKIAGRQY
ncbi:MAG: DUF5777 family beta-barrel protein [Chitinophagales bacterium]